MHINTFECQMYVARDAKMTYSLPLEDGPKKIALLEPVRYDDLIAPEFRRLLAAFHNVAANKVTVHAY